MKRNLFYALLGMAPLLYSQAPGLEWQKAFGGSNTEIVESMIQTPSGDIVAVGFTNSSDGDIADPKGESDGLVVKLNASGSVLWSRTLGGSSYDRAYSIVLMPDQTYMVLAGTSSTDGDVEGNNGDWNLWLVHLDPNGEIIAQKIIETQRTVSPKSLQLLADGFYIAGNAGSSGNRDYFLMKVNSSGVPMWESYYGGSAEDYLYKMIATTENHAVLIGNSRSNDGDISGNHGDDDCWIVKVKENGEMDWEKSFGGSEKDNCYSITETIGNSFLIGGKAFSEDGDLSGTYEGYDGWIFKINTSGMIEWQTNFKSEYGIQIRDIIQSNDLNYVVTGDAADKDIWLPFSDVYLAKVDSEEGTLIWENRFGGSNDEYAQSLIQANDGGYLLGGYTNSNDGDISGHHGNEDFWIVKTYPDQLYTVEMEAGSFKYYPNPAKNFIHFSQKLKNTVIFDLQGKILLQSRGNSELINVSGLPSGVYILKGINESGKMISVKVVKD